MLSLFCTILLCFALTLQFSPGTCKFLQKRPRSNKNYVLTLPRLFYNVRFLPSSFPCFLTLAHAHSSLLKCARTVPDFPDSAAFPTILEIRSPELPGAPALFFCTPRVWRILRTFCVLYAFVHRSHFVYIFPRVHTVVAYFLLFRDF